MLDIFGEGQYKATITNNYCELNADCEFVDHTTKNTAVYSGFDLSQLIASFLKENNLIDFKIDGKKFIFEYYKPSGETQTTIISIKDSNPFKNLFNKE